jgi:hypothetical protein
MNLIRRIKKHKGELLAKVGLEIHRQSNSKGEITRG